MLFVLLHLHSNGYPYGKTCRQNSAQSLGMHWKVFVPPMRFCTDNAAMVGIAGYFKYLRGEYADISLPPYAKKEG